MVIGPLTLTVQANCSQSEVHGLHSVVLNLSPTDAMVWQHSALLPHPFPRVLVPMVEFGVPHLHTHWLPLALQGEGGRQYLFDLPSFFWSF